MRTHENRKLTRRAFAVGALSAALLPIWSLAAEVPKLRFGILTDTHLTRDPKSAERVSAAFRLFRDCQCTLVTHLGDLADEAWPEAHEIYRRTFDEVFSDRKPQELFACAAHDVINFVPGKSWRLTPEERDAGYAAFCAHAGVPHPLFYACDVAGVPFVVAPQHADPSQREQMERMIADAEKRHPEGPIFVLYHVAPIGTLFHSVRWGSYMTPRLFERHPRVVCLSGHTHGSVSNERNIWQGGYTAVDAGCLQVWEGVLPGHQTKPKKSYGVLVCDVFDDRIVFHRLDVRDGRKIRDPWIVPLPFNPETAPYRPEVRAAQAPVPAFPAGAVLSVAKPVPDSDAVEVSFPSAEPVDDVLSYRVEVFLRGVTTDWDCFGREDVYGEFYLRPEERKGSLTCRFPKEGLWFSRDIRWRVTPVGFFGQLGKPLESGL